MQYNKRRRKSHNSSESTSQLQDLVRLVLVPDRAIYCNNTKHGVMHAKRQFYGLFIS